MADKVLDKDQLAQLWQKSINTFVIRNGSYPFDFVKSEYEKTINLFNKFDTEYGAIYSASGVTSGDTSCKHSDYIEIKPSTIYTNNMVGSWSSGSGLAFYDSSKTYISGIKSNNSAYTQFTTPSNAKYVRISYYIESGAYFTDENTLMLVEGSTLPSTYIKNYGSIVHKSEIYPVGSIYMSASSISPASFFGGTWEQLQNRFLLGAGSSYTAGATGGEATHTLIISEIPAHEHHARTRWVTGTEGTQGPAGCLQIDVGWSKFNSTDGGNVTSPTGGGTAHNNMPPYLVVYMWKRIA